MCFKSSIAKTTISSFGRFWKQRRAAGLKTSVTIGRGKGSPSRQSKPSQGYDNGPITITIDAEVSEDGHSAYVPAVIKGRRLREVRRGMRQESASRGEKLNLGVSDVLGRRVHLVPLSKGNTTLTAHYH